MTSLKQRIKSKIRPQKQVDTIKAFNQTNLQAYLQQGKTQLAQIKVHCGWITKNNLKQPKIICKWYNRTQNNIQQIIGIDEDVYQPSLFDVGSIIEVTCIPQVPGMIYDGMPILLKKTQYESKYIIEQKKGTFSLDIRQASINGTIVQPGSQGFFCIQDKNLIFKQANFGNIVQRILKQIQIDEDNPCILINRKYSRQLTIKFNENQYCIVYFKTNKSRDIFCLALRLIMSQNILKNQQQKYSKSQNKNQSTDESLTSRSEYKQEKVQNQKNQVLNKTQNTQQQTLNLSTNNATQMLQLITIKKQMKKLEQQNSKLLKQIQEQKYQNLNLKNNIQQMKEMMVNGTKNYKQLQNQIKLKQQNIQQLKQEIKTFKKVQHLKLQQNVYYKNQIKILNQQINSLTIQNKTTVQQNKILKQELSKYLQAQNEDKMSYSELVLQLQRIKNINNQLKLKYQFSLEQKQSIEEDLKNSRKVIQLIQSQKAHIQKKYQSITQQVNNNNMSFSRLSPSRSLQNSQLSNSFILEDIPALQKRQSFNSIIINGQQRQAQILLLKNQIRDLVEENNYIRSIISKQKKNSSRTQLKMQILQAKKINTKLSEALIDKDTSINNLRQINKEINKRNIALEQQLGQLLREINQLKNHKTN